MRRKILIVLLAFGTVLGYGGFVARLRHGPGPWGQRRAAFERHVSELCADAALRAKSAEPAPTH